MSHQNFGVSGFCFHFLRRVDLGYGPIRARNTARWATVAARSAGSKELLETLHGSKELMRVWPKEQPVFTEESFDMLSKPTSLLDSQMG